MFQVPGNNEVIVSMTSDAMEGYLQCWIDLNHDGDWNDPDEQVLKDVILTAGSNALSFLLSENMDVQWDRTYMRFRLSTQPGLLPVGWAPDGEVEDYRVSVEP